MYIKYRGFDGQSKTRRLGLPKLGFFSRFSRPRQAGKKETGIATHLLPQKGRSSKDVNYIQGLDALAGHYGELNPYVPIELISYITLLSVVNPDVAQAVRNMRVMVNTGHKLMVDDPQGKKVEAILDRLNEQAYAIYQRSCGVDGLINHYGRQLCVSGALSSEDVIKPDFSGVEKVVLVPTFSIRFKPGDDQPYQRVNAVSAGLDLIELNDHTYQYFALDLIENSPYAIPPLCPALEQIQTQKEMFKNISYIMKKLGLLGLNVVKVGKLEKQPGESDEKFRQRNQDYIKEVASILKDNYSDGMLVLPDEQEFTNFNVAGDARGIRDLIQVIEEQVITGLGGDPAMFGRSYSTTETYATVTYQKLLAEAANMRRLIKRRQEETYRLDLALAGLEVEGLSLVFNPNPKLNPNTETLADKYFVETILKKVRSGAISPQQAANELGYEEWYDESLIQDIASAGIQMKSLSRSRPKEFRFNQASQRYVFVRRNLGNISQSTHTHSVNQSKEEEKARGAQRKLTTWIDKYLRVVLPFYDQLTPAAAAYAQAYAEQNIEAVSENPELFLQAIKNYIRSNPHYKVWQKFQGKQKDIVIETGKYFKTSDLTAFGGKEPQVRVVFTQGDVAAMERFAQIDNFLFSKFIDNKGFGGEIKEFVNTFLERGEALFTEWTEEMRDDFLRRFGHALEGDLEYQMRRIVNTSVSRIRNNCHLEQLHDAGIEYARVTGVLDINTCSVCEPLIGKLFKVADARQIAQSIVTAGSVEESLEIIKATNIQNADDAKAMVDRGEIKIATETKTINGKKVITGRGLPIYHVSCRCGLEGVIA